MSADASIPSIKGTAFSAALDAVKQLLEQGQLSDDKLEVALDPDELELIEDDKVQPIGWYPFATFAKLVELACDALYGGTAAGHRKMGADAAQKLIDLGIYRQTSASLERDGESWIEQLERLPSLLYNFSRWKLEQPEPGKLELVVADAEPFPDWFGARLDGYAGVLIASATGVPIESYRRLVERPSRDIVRLTYKTG